MPKYTEHYNLIKPGQTETYNIENVTCKNADVIDTELYKKLDKQAGLGLSEQNFTTQYKKKVDNITEQAKGDSAYQVAAQEGFKGTEQEWLESLKRKRRTKR